MMHRRINVVHCSASDFDTDSVKNKTRQLFKCFKQRLISTKGKRQ